MFYIKKSWVTAIVSLFIEFATFEFATCFQHVTVCKPILKKIFLVPIEKKKSFKYIYHSFTLALQKVQVLDFSFPIICK